MQHQLRYDAYVEKVNNAIEYYFPMLPNAGGRLFEAAHYSLCAGGKRLRPVLLMESTRMFGAPVEDSLPFACAVEMIHTYSLIHDDLPSVDNDTMRRGKPTNHVVYGEATALLAGDALLTEAFEIMLDEDNCPSIPARTRLTAAHLLARAAGITGMAGGQMMDLDSSASPMTLSQVTEMHKKKTGALITAAVEIGAVLAGASREHRTAICSYAQMLALAFQAQDDLLDAVGSRDIMGKDPGQDISSGKTTLFTLLGESGCRELVLGLSEKAKMAAEGLPDNDFLLWLADHLAVRAT